MRNILVFLSIVILINCATIPINQQDQFTSSTEPVQDYTNIETTQVQETTNRNGDQLKRCSDCDIVSSSYQPDNVLALSRREINLFERNRERCENCRRNPICKDISRCRTCKRICDRVAEQLATSTTTTTESTANNIPIEPIVGLQPQFNPDEITMRFADESSNNYQERYFTIGAVQSGATMDLIAKLFNVDNPDGLEQFVILGKLKQDGDSEGVANSRQLFIWDLGKVFGWNNKPIVAEIHSIESKIDDNEKIDLAEELNRELDKAIRKRKGELGQNQLSRDEIDNLINATMTEILKRRNDTVGCSIEEDFGPIVDLRIKQQPETIYGNIHKTPIVNPPVIQDSFQPKSDTGDIIGEPLTSTEAQLLPESDNQVNNVSQYNSSDDISGSSKSAEDPRVGDSNLPNSIQNAGAIQKDITKIVEDSFKIPGIFESTGESPVNRQSSQNIQKVVEDSLKMSAPNNEDTKVDQNVVDSSRNIQEEIKNLIENSRKLAEPNDNIVKQQNPDLSNKNQLTDNPNIANSQPKNLQETIQKIIEDSLKLPEPNDNIVKQESPNLLETDQKTVLPTEENSQLESQKDLEQVQKTIDDLESPSTTDTAQGGPNFPTRNQINEPRLMESASPQPAAAQAVKTTSTVPVAPYEGMPVEEIPIVFPYDLARPIPNTSEYDALRQFEGMPAERMSKVFPYHLAQPFTQLPGEPTNELNPTINNATTTPINVMENAVGSPIPANRGGLSNTDEKFHTFGSLIPIPGQNADANVRNVYFLGKDITLPLQMYQDTNGVMQLSVDMEKLCNCKNKTCMKTHKNLEEFGNSLWKNIETGHDFKKTSDIMKRSPKIDNFPSDNDNYLELEDKLDQLNRVVEKFEEESENLLEESTKVLLKNVENEGNVQQSVDLINKMLKWMRTIVTEKQN